MHICVILSAVCADPGRDIFYDKGHHIPINGDGCRVLFGIPLFADTLLHFASLNCCSTQKKTVTAPFRAFWYSRSFTGS